MESVAEYTGFWRVWRDCRRPLCYFPSGLILRVFTFGTPLGSLKQQVKERQQDEQYQDKDLFQTRSFHSCLSYFLLGAPGSSPVSAIASRIAVSACTFFIR
jgi:hypothetical protein